MTYASRDYRAADDYHSLPYTSMPIAYTQPARLAAMALLHGLQAPAVECARVLEIGCASGGNIIPLAARFPTSRFLGIDLSARHVELGARRIAELGLSNIELRRDDIARIDLSGERFDYIICHGVFSWVPRTAQDAILKICASCLTDFGIAAISYNVLPGWHMRSIIRDISIRHTGAETDPLRRATMVRELLAELADSVRDDGPYGQILRSEAARLRARPASYILGEFLADVNEPLHFKDFVSRAATSGLHYLCESDLCSSRPQSFVPSAAARIERLAGDDLASQQQYTDVFSGRTFRRSLLARAGSARDKLCAPGPERVRSLHCAARLRVDTAASSESEAWFRDRADRVIKVRSDPARTTLTHLARIYPSTASVQEIADLCPTDGTQQRLSIEASICRAIFRLAATGRAVLSSMRLTTGRSASQLPHVWGLARAEAATDQPWVTSLSHASVLLNPPLKFLVRQMNGENTKSQLAASLALAVSRGAISPAEIADRNGQKGQSPLMTDYGEYVEHALDYCATHALLTA